MPKFCRNKCGRSLPGYASTRTSSHISSATKRNHQAHQIKRGNAATRSSELELRRRFHLRPGDPGLGLRPGLRDPGRSRTLGLQGDGGERETEPRRRLAAGEPSQPQHVLDVLHLHLQLRWRVQASCGLVASRVFSLATPAARTSRLLEKLARTWRAGATASARRLASRRCHGRACRVHANLPCCCCY